MRTEQTMREETVPYFSTLDDLSTYIDALVAQQHDYGTCVYAMSMAATGALNFVAGKLGCTGFQASCADLDILRRTRQLGGPFLILKAEDELYPQYNNPERLEEARREWKDWLKEQAKKKLQDHDDAHPRVIAHWKKLAE